MLYIAALVSVLLQDSGPKLRCSPADSLVVRNAHAMVYHDARREVMLFGGADEKQVLADLWSWDGSKWTCIASGGPPPRTFPSLAYDSARGRLVLFGGNRVLFGTHADTATFLDDMWTWDGEDWRKFQTPTPSARAEAAMVYDPDRDRIVLFGGYRNDGDTRIRLGDTWEWDGRRWEERNVAGPWPRNGAAAAYDSKRHRVVLFGGSGSAGDTWEWDGAEWAHITSADTIPRFNAAMAYDEERDAIIRFGGWTGEGRAGDTWQLDERTWRKVAEKGPAPRNHTSLVYDLRRQVIVLFGGHDGDHVFGDTWEWNGEVWTQRSARSRVLRIDNGH